MLIGASLSRRDEKMRLRPMRVRAMCGDTDGQEPRDEKHEHVALGGRICLRIWPTKEKQGRMKTSKANRIHAYMKLT